MAANEAIYRHGDSVTMIDHTPGSALSGGHVEVVGDLPLVAHRDMPANEKGALAAGGGVYEMTADAAIATGKRVYWNATARKVTATASTHKQFGYITDDTSAAADGDKVNVLHKPEDGA